MTDDKPPKPPAPAANRALRRRDKRPKSLFAPPPSPPASDARISADLSALTDRARDGIAAQAALRATVAAPDGDLVVLVLDGTSPLAFLAPPEFRAGGGASVSARLMFRAELAARVRDRFPGLADQLAVPLPCGHLAYFVTTATGGALTCTVCELGLTPPVVGSA